MHSEKGYTALPEGNKTPLYYASLQSISGIAFKVGPHALFAPMEDQSIYVVDTTHLMVTAEVPAGPVRSYILDEIAGKLAAQQPKRGGKNL